MCRRRIGGPDVLPGPKEALLLALRSEAAIADLQLEIRPGKFCQVGILDWPGKLSSEGETLKRLMMKAGFKDLSPPGESESKCLSLGQVEAPARQLELRIREDPDA